MTFTAVVTAHAESPHKILGNLLYQTRPPDELLVLVSDVSASEVAKLREHFPKAQFFPQPNFNDWGHEKRSAGVQWASGDYLGFFNSDDEYELDYIEKMMKAVGVLKFDAAFCGWTGEHGNPHPTFTLGSSTSGNFIVRTELAQRVGYWSRAYEADGHFINAVRSNAKRIAFVNDVLYHHH